MFLTIKQISLAAVALVGNGALGSGLGASSERFCTVGHSPSSSGLSPIKRDWLESSVLVDPRNTSQERGQCGHFAAENRSRQSSFRCVSCGWATHADINAALVIRSRAAVNPPRAAARLSDVYRGTPTSAKNL